MCVKLSKIYNCCYHYKLDLSFYCSLFWHMRKLDQMKQERLTNEKIFQQTTQKNTSQGVIRETNDAAETKKGDSETEQKSS